jgi:hypothetical protein
MQRLEVSGAVRHIYIYIYVIRRLKVKHNQQDATLHNCIYSNKYHCVTLILLVVLEHIKSMHCPMNVKITYVIYT